MESAPEHTGWSIVESPNANVDFPRLDGTPATQTDMHNIALTGYDIAGRELTSEGEDEEPPTLKPVKGGYGGSRSGALAVYMLELNERLNSLSDEATPPEERVAFVNQVAAMTRENPVVMAQIKKNSKDQALKGDLPGAAQAAVVRAMSSHSSLAILLLRKDRQACRSSRGGSRRSRNGAKRLA